MGGNVAQQQQQAQIDGGGDMEARIGGIRNLMRPLGKRMQTTLMWWARMLSILAVQ